VIATATPADLRAERPDRLPVVRVEARQLIEPVVDRRRLRHHPPEGVRRHAEAGRNADAVDAQQGRQVRGLAADDRGPRPVDLVQTHHVPLVAIHRQPPPFRRFRSGRRFCASSRVLPQAPRRVIR
jgi:hypothetical protein